jgi:outer membrane protein assembly factor BamB
MKRQYSAGFQVLRIAGLSAILLGPASRLSAEFPAPADWPMFRGGPALVGVSPVTLRKELALLWSFKTGGPVKSSPAVVANRVFVGSGDNSVYALDVNSGRKVWSAKTEGPIESSPLVLNGRVYVGSSDASLYALDAQGGKLLWKYTTGDKILGSPNWVKSPAGDATWILIGSYDFKLHCVDAVTGKSNWVYESGNYINGSPAVADGQTVFGGCDAVLHIISLADGKEVKQVEAGAYIAASVAIANRRAYFGHYENEFLCVDLDKGTNLWTFKDRAFPYFSSPAVAGEA